MWILPRSIISLCALDTTALVSDLPTLASTFAPSLTWRSKHSPSLLWLRRLKRERWLALLSGRILRPSHSASFTRQWSTVCCQPDSLASPSVKTVLDAPQKTPAICGPTLQMELPLADLATFSSKMSRASSVPNAETNPEPPMEPRYCSMSSKTWNREVTAQRGEFSRRLNAGQPIDASESIYWPTPTVAEGQKIPNRANYGQVALSNHPSIVGTTSRQPHVKTYRDGVGPIGLTNHNMDGNAHALNPDWVEQLMGLPVRWTDCACSATESSPQPHPLHGKLSADDYLSTLLNP